MPYSDPAAQREYQRQWRANRRAEFFAEKCCVRCQATDDLRLDHIDPKLKVSHKIWSWSLVRRELEIAKCQVLCESCHREKTAEDMGYQKHGTDWAYRNGCHCDECRAYNTLKTRAYRLKKKGLSDLRSMV